MEKSKEPVVVSGFYTPTAEDKERFKNLSICILTPCREYKSPILFTRSVANMVAYSWMHGLRIHQMGITENMVVDWARNDLARIVHHKINDYTGEEFTHLLWLDDDHIFNADLACVLASHDKDMVSALYYARTGKPLPVVYVHGGEDDYKHYPLIIVPNRLFEVDAVGFGAMLMRRDVLDRVPEPWFTVDWRAGEDIAFCVKAKQHGVKIWCDARYKLGHIGAPQIVSQKDYQKYLDEHQDEFSDKVKVALGD